MNSKIDIILVGCGKMGQAMLRGWLLADYLNHIYVLEPQTLPEALIENAKDKITHYKSLEGFSNDTVKADILVLAVKPQIMGDVCSSIKASVAKDTLVISVAAGQTIAGFEKHFGNEQPIVRAMPNTPASIGKGITVCTKNTYVSDQQSELTTKILQSVGLVNWVENEALLDPVTALSGSGPAYLFLLIEMMTKAGERAGLSSELSNELARHTVIGSALLAEHEGGLSPSELRENVTSPGGTTAAALDILMAGDFQEIMDKAILAATNRSKELSS